MTRSELVKKVRNGSFEITHSQVEQLVSIILNGIIRAVDSGQRVELRNFSTFLPRERQARMGRNPRTGETVSVSASRIMFFKAGKDLKDRLNGKKAEQSIIPNSASMLQTLRVSLIIPSKVIPVL